MFERDSERPWRLSAASDGRCPGVTRRYVVRSLAATVPIAGTIGSLPAARANDDANVGDGPTSGSLVNDYLDVYVDTDGTYEISTTEGDQLTYPSAGTSGLTIRVDETNYTIGTVQGTSMGQYRADTTVDPDAGVATTTWELPGKLVVKQQIRLAGPAAGFDLTVRNGGEGAHDVAVRYLFDYQVGPQDGAPIFASGEVLTAETRFQPPPFDSWQTYDQLPNPSLTGRGTLDDRPDTIEFVGWPDAENSSYEYEAFDPEKQFYREGYTSNPESDSAGLLYFELGTIDQGSEESITTYYGVDEPLQSEASQLQRAFDDYRDAVVDYVDRTVAAKAEGYARQYLRADVDDSYGLQERDDRSWAFRSSIVEFFEYRAGNADESVLYETYFDDVRTLADAIPDDLSEDEAADLAAFTDEMFEAVPEGDPDDVEEDAVATFEAYLLGTADGQENTLTVGGSTLSELRDTFVDEFDQRSGAFVADCQQQDVDPETIDGVVRQLDHRTEELSTQAAEKATHYRSIVDRAVEGDRVASAADTMTVAGAVGGAVGGTVGLGAGMMLAGETDEAPALVGVGTSVGSAIGTAVGGVVPPVPSDGGIGGTRWSRSFVESDTWKAITAFELQWLYNLAEAPVRVLPNALLRYADDDLAATVTTTPGEMFDVGCEETARGIDAEAEVRQVRTDNVTEDSRLGRSRLAVGDGAVTVYNPESNDRAIRPAFLEDECMVVPHTTAQESGQGYLTLPPRSELPEIPPGEEAAVPFSYVTPYRSNADFELQFRVKASPAARPVESAIGFVPHQVGPAAEVQSETVSGGTVNEGESRDGSVETGDATRGEMSLVYGGSDLDLHLYDADGSHVGRNYQNGDFENQIDGAAATGSDGGTGYESIELADLNGTYTARAVAVETPRRGSTFSVTSARSDELPASPETVESDVSLSGDPNDEVTTTLTLRETAGDTALTDLDAELSDLETDDGETADFAVATDFDDVSVDAGDSGDIDLSVEIPGGTSEGRYSGTLTVDAADQSLELPLDVAVRNPDSGLPDWLLYSVGAGLLAGGGTLGYRYLSSTGDGGRRPPAQGPPPQGEAQSPQSGQQPLQDGQPSGRPHGGGDATQNGEQWNPQGSEGTSGESGDGSAGDGPAGVYCPNCGAENHAGSTACVACGQRFG